jgi:heat shock protein HslJ
MNGYGRLLALLLSLCASIAGCDAGSSRGDSLAVRLADREFLSLSLRGHELVEGTEIRVRFHDGELSASAGCNHMSGTFTIEGDVLRITSLSSTEIGCDPDLHAQDEWIQDLLTDSPTLELDDPELTIETEHATLKLIDREVGSPDRGLVGTHWVGNGTGDEQAISFGPGSGSVTVDFEGDGSLAVFTACQNGTGTFTASQSTIELDDVGYDDVTCSNPGFASLAAQVRFVLASGARVSFEIEEANLTLEREGKLLLFRAEE